MSQRSLDEFGAYRKAKELFGLVVTDMELLRREPLCFKLVSQQIGSADSICVNIEEGHGRLSRRRTALADEILGILTPTIERLPSQPNPTPTERLREDAIAYGS